MIEGYLRLSTFRASLIVKCQLRTSLGWAFKITCAAIFQNPETKRALVDLERLPCQQTTKNAVSLSGNDHVSLDASCVIEGSRWKVGIKQKDFYGTESLEK